MELMGSSLGVMINNGTINIFLEAFMELVSSYLIGVDPQKGDRSVP